MSDKIVPIIKHSLTPMDLLNRAYETNADIDKLEQLMGLQERWEAAEAKKAYTQAMSKFRAECPSILRTRTGHHDIKYAGLAETIDTIKDLLAQCGLSHSWKINDTPDLITVNCCVTHVQGHAECTSMSGPPDTTGSKNAMQARASTVSYLERYTLFAILGMASSEMDDDGYRYKRLKQDQIEALQVLIFKAKTDESKFCKHMGVGSLSEIPFESFGRARDALLQKVKSNENPQS